MVENFNIIEMENEYKKIENMWLILHFSTSIGLVAFVFIIECIIGLVLFNLGEIDIPIKIYILKYILLPTISNLSFIIIGYFVIHSYQLTQSFKIYTISLLFVAICFIVFSVHSIFTSVYMVFTFPILFTLVYGKYCLTTVISLFSVLAKIFSDIFVKCDSSKVYIWNSNIEIVNFIVCIVIFLAFYAVCMVIIGFEKGKKEVSIQREIERYKLKQKLHNDELTSINNRTALRKAFQSMEEDISNDNYFFAMIDIDNFKIINDTYGHTIGDTILKEFAEILKTNCINATPFRFGGDEFCILFKNHPLEVVVEICKTIQDNFKKIIDKNKVSIQSTVSFGIAHYLHKMTATQLLNNADSALYSAKTIKDAIHIYEDLI